MSVLWVSAVGLLAGLLSSLPRAAVAAAHDTAKQPFVKKSQIVCVFDGAWADGGLFHYHGWNSALK